MPDFSSNAESMDFGGTVRGKIFGAGELELAETDHSNQPLTFIVMKCGATSLAEQLACGLPQRNRNRLVSC